MQQYYTGVLLTLLLVIPAFMGLWWAPKMKLVKTDSMLHRLQLKRQELRQHGQQDKPRHAAGRFLFKVASPTPTPLCNNRRSPKDPV